MTPPIRFMAAVALGATTVTGFAPVHAAIVPIFTFAGLLLLLQRAASPSLGAWVGFGFGLGLFGVGVSWIFISLQRYSGLPDALCVVATLLFCAVFALYPALFGYGAVRWRKLPPTLLLLPSLWTVTELIRGTLLGGFSWLSLGYSQASHSVLSGYAPLLGQYGITFMVALLGACLSALVLCSRQRVATASLAVAVLAGGWGLQLVPWTQQQGRPVPVSLLQGNIPQDRKWQQSELEHTLKTYLALAQQASGRLIVLPETALPLPQDQIPPMYREALLAAARAKGAELIVGVPERTVGDDAQYRYYNSAVLWGPTPMPTYRKARLVPFGEFIPRLPLVEPIVQALSIPLSDMSAGPAVQAPLPAASARLAMNICFENIFGAATAQSAIHADAIVNLSNLAWFGQSLAPAQFLQMAQMRALEAGREVMLATNTGPTAVINHLGGVRAQAPVFSTTVLSTAFVRRVGVTPYSRFDDLGILLILSSVLLLATLMAWRHRRQQENNTPFDV